MAKQQPVITLPFLKAVDPAFRPIGLQLVQCLRDAIATGALKPGKRLPSSRALASFLKIANGTVVEASLHAGRVRHTRGAGSRGGADGLDT
jgi:GntR family transcriptional regulator/MocR family aminotransferase